MYRIGESNLLVLGKASPQKLSLLSINYYDALYIIAGKLYDKDDFEGNHFPQGITPYRVEGSLNHKQIEMQFDMSDNEHEHVVLHPGLKTNKLSMVTPSS